MAFPGPSSPLSDLDETSFYTALESPATPFPSKPAETAVDNGAASHSVPLPSSAWSHTEEAPTRTSLVEAESLSRELTQHCAIYLEEQLYTYALTLLSSTLCGSLSSGPRRHHAPLVPPPSHVALLATVAVHPAFTTRAVSVASQPAGSSGTGAVGTAPATAAGVTGDLEVASVALAYLRQLLATVGARGGGFVESFRFRVREIVVGGRQRRRRRGAGNENGDDDDDDDDYYSDSQASRTSGSAAADTDALAGRFANEQSVWSSGSDLWHVVGWALGCCTVLHKHRWRVWRPWLAMLLDVIESDWEERKQGRGHGNVGTDGGQTSGVEKTSAGLENSMLIRFLVDNVGRGSTAVKRAVRAIFAGTDRLSLSQYHPVFEREAMIRRVADETGERKRKRSDMLDLKNDKFGDYFADDDDDDSVPSSQQSIPGLSGSGGAGIVSNNTLVEALGDSLVLRYRLLDLLIQAARDAPEHFSPMQALCFEIGRTLNAVPLDVFEAFVLHAPPEVPRSSVLCILESAAALLLPDNIRASAASGRVRTSSSTMDLATLRDRYACHAAGTASAGDNARLSLLIEKSLLVLWTAPDDDGGHEVARKSASEIDLDEVRLAVKRGIAARDSRWKKPRLVATAASSRQRGRPSKTRQSNHAAAEDPPGAATLRESAARIIEILDIMQAAAGGVTDADMDVDSAGE